MTAWTPRVLSVSAVELYMRCPAAYHRRYIARITDPKTAPMAFGIVMAKALEALHRGEDGELALVREYASQITAAGLQYAPPLQHGLALLATYQARGVPAGTPECKFVVDLPDREAVPVPLLGYMDHATEEGVYEFKMSSGGWSQGRADGSYQSALYRYGYWKTFDRKPQWVKFLVFSTRAVRIDEYTTYPAGPELRLFETAAASVWRGVREGAFEPRCHACPACAALGLTKPVVVAPTWDFE